MATLLDVDDAVPARPLFACDLAYAAADDLLLLGRDGPAQRCSPLSLPFSLLFSLFFNAVEFDPSNHSDHLSPRGNGQVTHAARCDYSVDGDRQKVDSHAV